MDKVYLENPHNFERIEEYVITDTDEIARQIICAKKCYVYDACAFRDHMKAPCGELVAHYIKETSGIVIITRTILMELCSNDGCLWEEHITFIKQLYSNGLKVLIIYEEDIFGVLHTYSSDVLEINKWLSFAVRCAKSKVGKIETVVGRDVALRKYLFEGVENKDGTLAEKMFQKVRNSKTSSDNMGEELLAVCLHWLSHICESYAYKYIVLTDDKKSIPIFGKVMKNVREYYNVESIALCTTVKLCCLMKESGIINVEHQIKDIMSNINGECSLKIYCSKEFELGPVERIMSIQEFAKMVFDNNMKIYY